MEIFVMIIISIAVSALAYMIAPKASSGSTASADMDNPTADADRVIPVVFGSVRLTSPNFLWIGDKSKREYKVSA